ncbi:MAG: hypothetical protein ACLFSQ_09700 [Candidatus Zixiibacteriota bacterium]
MKKTLILAFAILLIAGLAFGEEEKADTDNTIKVYSDFAEAKETGKTVLCFFYTQKSCACTNKKCKSAMDLMHGIRKGLPEDIAYCELETADHADLVKEYRLVSPPVVLIFNQEGKQVSRLDSWKIKKQNIEAELEKLDKDN